MTYAPCKLPVKSELHGAAFVGYAPRSILRPMANNRHYLRAWREYRGLTQADVVNRLVVLEDPKLPRTEATLSRVETNKQIYTERLLLALADIYDAEPSELLGRDPTKDGKIIDLMALLNDKQRLQAAAVIEAILKTG